VFGEVSGVAFLLRGWKKECCTQEAVLAFKAYIEDGDEGPLSAMFEAVYLKSLKRDLSLQGYEELDLAASICLNCHSEV